MAVSVTLDDVVQDESGYSVQFDSRYTSCVEQYDDLAAYANDVIERYAKDVLRAILILRWIDSNRLGETASLSDAGRVQIIG